MLIRKAIKLNSLVSKHMMRFSALSFTTQNLSETHAEDDAWNNWEFGSFATKTRKTTEQAYADRRCHDVRSQVSRNIDNEWSYLSDR